MHARQSAERRGARGGGATIGGTNSSTAPSRGCTVIGRAALSGSTMTVCDGIATPGWKCARPFSTVGRPVGARQSYCSRRRKRAACADRATVVCARRAYHT